MKKIKVELEGMTPLLMNSPKGMLTPEPEMKSTRAKYDPKIEAEKVAYRDDNKLLYAPAEAIKGSLLNAGSYKKVGKYSLKPLLAGNVRVVGDKIVLKSAKTGKDLSNYDIDIRTVVIQRSRVVKARPLIKDWKLAFELEYNEKYFPNPEPLKDCLIEAGERVGLLDFRPQKNGSFGMFKVTKFEVVK